MGLLILGALGVGSKKTHGETLFAGTSSSTYSVHIVLNGQGEGVVDDQLDILHIQPSTGNVGGDEGCLLAGFEVCNGLCSGGLRHVTLKGASLVVTLVLQELLQPRCLLLVEAEDDDLLVGVEMLLQGGQQAVGFVLVVPEDLHLLPDGGVRDQALVNGTNADMHGLLEELCGQVVHGGGPGGAEHASLTLASLGHQLNQFLDDVDEAHVQHAIGLVEDQVLDMGEIERTLVDQILQSARRRDEHVHANGLEGLTLLLLRDTAKDALHGIVVLLPARQGLGKLCANLGNLHRQLSRGRHRDEAGHVRWLLEDVQLSKPRHGEVRQSKGHGLSTASLRDTADV
mmetsp:Transcript_45473/g.97431  ORF Transcript_45473/g.97431 Transcript_45473/m.97431 type:complete len:342 (+) Transcript_45473:498-1523(+)